MPDSIIRIRLRFRRVLGAPPGLFAGSTSRSSGTASTRFSAPTVRARRRRSDSASDSAAARCRHHRAVSVSLSSHYSCRCLPGSVPATALPDAGRNVRVSSPARHRRGILTKTGSLPSPAPSPVETPSLYPHLTGPRQNLESRVVSSSLRPPAATDSSRVLEVRTRARSRVEPLIARPPRSLVGRHDDRASGRAAPSGSRMRGRARFRLPARAPSDVRSA